MGSNYNTLLHTVRDLKIKGKSAQAMRAELLQDGWDRHTVDRALWRLHIRDRHNTQLHRKMRMVGIVASVFLAGLALVAYSIQVDKRHTNQKGVAGVATSDQTQTPEISPGQLTESIDSKETGIRFSYSSDWTVQSTAPGEAGGSYKWQIEHIENAPIKKALKEKYGIPTSGSNDGSAADYALINDPLVRQLVTINITVYPADSTEVEDSLDAWKANVDRVNGQYGFSAKDFTPIVNNGINGYRYISSIELGQVNISTLEYLFLQPGKQRIEISIFPVSSKHNQQINTILQSLNIQQ